MKEIKLPSGAILKITLSPFAVSRELYRAILDEAKGIKLNAGDEVDVNLFKDLACTMLASRNIEQCLWECMKKATINDIKITPDSFESVESRDDYITVCIEVAKENVLPFMKSLSAQYAPMLDVLKNNLA